jgi:hypothetical protein
MPVHRMTAGDGRRIDVRQGRGAAIGRRGQDRRDSECSPRALAPGSLSTSGWRCVAFRDLWCEIRCHLRTEVNERFRWFPDVDVRESYLFRRTSPDGGGAQGGELRATGVEISAVLAPITFGTVGVADSSRPLIYRIFLPRVAYRVQTTLPVRDHLGANPVCIQIWRRPRHCEIQGQP